MADTPVNRLYESISDNVASSATASIADGSVVLVTIQMWGNSDNNLAAIMTSTLAVKTVANEGWHLNATRAAEWANYNQAGYGADFLKVYQFWAVKDGAGTGTVTVNNTLGSGMLLSVDEIVGADVNYPIAQYHHDGNATGGTGITGTLPFTPASTSQIISGASVRDNSTPYAMGVISGFTELGGVDDRHSGISASALGSNGTSYGYTIATAPASEQGAGIAASEIRDDLAGLPPPTGLCIFEYTLASSTHVTASISPTDTNSLVCVRITMHDDTASRTVSSIGLGGTLVMTDAFAEVADSGAWGTSDVRTFWWVGRYASGSGALTITMSGSCTLVGTQVVEINSADIDFTDPIGATLETGIASVANNVLFPAAGALSATPADTSVVLSSFVADGVSNFGPSDAIDSRVTHWAVDTLTQDEGQGQTNFMTHNPGAIGTVVGGYFGDNATSQSGGAAVASIEIKVAAAAAGGSASLIGSNLINSGTGR